MAKTALAGGLLFGTWLILAGNLRVEVVVTGMAASVASVLVFRTLIAGERWLGHPERLKTTEAYRNPFLRRIRRVLWILAFGPVFLWKVLLSGINIAVLALKPTMDFWPGIVRVEGGMRSVTGTALFANLLTLTPGTLTIDYDERGDALYIHWIDVTSYREADFDYRVTSGLREWMKRIEA